MIFFDINIRHLVAVHSVHSTVNGVNVTMFDDISET